MSFCPACGIWRCEDCGRKKYYANRFSADPQKCRCGSGKGKMLPIAHTSGHLKDHELDYKAFLIAMRAPRYPLEES